MNFSRDAGFLLFRILLPVAVLAIQYALYRVARRWIKATLPGSKRAGLLIAVPFLVFNLALVGVMIVRPRSLDYPGWFLWSCVYPFLIWHSATFFTGLVLGAVTVIRLPFRIATLASMKVHLLAETVKKCRSTPAFTRFDASRRSFLRTGLVGVAGVSFAGSTYGILVGRSGFDTTAAEFRIRNLPPQLRNFTIALASDVHSSAFMTRPAMEEYASALNSLGADMIVIPGDFVNSMTEEVYPFAEAFSTLRAPHGVYGVMGNHDYFAQEPEKVAREVNSCGIRMLRNQSATIEKDGARLCIAGIDDVGRPDRAMQRMTTAFEGVSGPVPRILLCHRPYFLDVAAASGVDLVLSGHTHGGQIVLGRIGNVTIAPASLASRYVWGKYRLGGAQMYVSRGLGTVGLPIRINCPPEITRITLLDETTS